MSKDVAIVLGVVVGVVVGYMLFGWPTTSGAIAPNQPGPGGTSAYTPPGQNSIQIAPYVVIQ